ncbi:hypothetical protein PV327_004142 [Microctonus hyperodae]|uniref:Uncharacterized protein n=1 Tax=Microctonus hyperodae TaxID=165561 RepID=A0AA39FBU0_MICHY|nr:hypothetical protein PV327_004142 [Microctonus hyperodae]
MLDTLHPGGHAAVEALESAINCRVEKGVRDGMVRPIGVSLGDDDSHPGGRNSVGAAHPRRSGHGPVSALRKNRQGARNSAISEVSAVRIFRDGGIPIYNKKLFESLQIDENGQFFDRTQKAFSQDVISQRASNMRPSKIDKKRNKIVPNHNDVELDTSEESSSCNDIPHHDPDHGTVINSEENNSLPKNLFWIPDVTTSQIAWQKRILDSMIASYQKQKEKGYQLEIGPIEKELCTNRADKVKIAPNWERFLRKGRFLQILSRHDAANWTKIVLELLVEVYGNDNLKYMSAKGTRNTIGVNQNLRYAIMDLLFSLNVNITEEKLTKVINKFCSNRKVSKRSMTNDSKEEMPPAKKHASSRNNILEV